MTSFDFMIYPATVQSCIFTLAETLCRCKGMGG
jgi:hypothetical protein